MQENEQSDYNDIPQDLRWAWDQKWYQRNSE